MATQAKMARERKKLKFKVRYRNRCRRCGRDDHTGSAPVAEVAHGDLEA